MTNEYDEDILRITREYERLCGNTSFLITEPSLLKASYFVQCAFRANLVVEKVKQILQIIDKVCTDRIYISTSTFPNIDEWKSLLPLWFVEKFKPERNSKQLEEYLSWWDSLNSKQKQQQIELPRSWELSAWIYYLSPDEREWYWYDCIIVDGKSFVISVEVKDFPYMSGAFYWLLQASGANKIEEIDNEE